MRQFCIVDTAGSPIPGTVRDDSLSAVLAFFDTDGNRHLVEIGWEKCRAMGYRLMHVEVEVLKEASMT